LRSKGQSLRNQAYSGTIHQIFLIFYMGLEGHECRKVKKPYFFGRFLFPWKQGQKVKFDHLKDIAIFYYFRMRYLYRDSTGNPYLVHF